MQTKEFPAYFLIDRNSPKRGDLNRSLRGHKTLRPAHRNSRREFAKLNHKFERLRRRQEALQRDPQRQDLAIIESDDASAQSPRLLHGHPVRIILAIVIVAILLAAGVCF